MLPCSLLVLLCLSLVPAGLLYKVAEVVSEVKREREVRARDPLQNWSGVNMANANAESKPAEPPHECMFLAHWPAFAR